MRIRTRLVAAFLACGLIPMFLSSLVNLYNGSNGSNRISDQASDDLSESTKHQLVAARDLKSAEVGDFFKQIESQVTTLSASPAIIDAVQCFKEGASSIVAERSLDAEMIANMRRELNDYYVNQFGSKYENDNNGKASAAASRLAAIDDAAVALQHAYIFENQNELGNKHQLDFADHQTTYDRTHQKYHPFLRSFLEEFGYYDIFLIDDKTGDVVYSVFKELDYATDLRTGPYSKSNFAKAFVKAASVASPSEAVLVDFEPYYPSYEAPASFIASPIYKGTERVGVLVFQMPIDRIADLVARDIGIGKTCETLLVSAEGQVLCNTGNQEAHQAAKEQGKFDANTEAAKKAHAGQNGVIEGTNYAGIEVVSAYSPINLLGLNWAIVTEVSRDEAFAGVADLVALGNSVQSSIFWTGLGLFVLASIAIGAVSYWIAGTIVRPITATVDMLRDISEGEGDLTRRLDEQQAGELGELSVYFNRFAGRIHDIVKSITGNVTTLSSASNQLSTTANNLANGTEQTKNQSSTVSSAAEELSINMENMSRNTANMTSSMSSVSQAVEEMKQTIAEIAKNAEQSAQVAADASISAEISNTKISNMGTAANEIGRVIEVIQDIAEQTNLLALNATIEAARAGEAGKGFAVVATEVKQLAKQTAGATDDIRTRIQAMQESTNEAVASIGEISQVIARVNELSRMIATAVEEQSITTGQISEHVNETSSLAKNVAMSVSESATASREITENISMVDSVLQETACGIDQSRDSGEELHRLAMEMSALVAQFRTDESAKSKMVTF
ncbi:methyl-accepting chemotaxis protein [Neorhodopirellula pilleata]|uniref:Methyl-accepting chemotaxis protein PctB n=1 Tax=Neorhodopirellula pilleata TaxID=2714738 RepID=A0A5C6AAQ5_9BACT|nr:methyl-accepting chemotaxis protein [Neorhodopirellula pilleata]TWT96235.1 Methyl-accepting chemotaxis protein PctB [Neorhodopirellula pilleata]